MAHMVETMAYAGAVPWHGLGRPVPADLTSRQMLEAAQLDWVVEKVPAYVEIAGQQVAIDRSALVRTSDNSILTTVNSDWNPIQNEEAFDFFNAFVEAGDMEMHTAGSLDNGRVVWALAKVKDGFKLWNKDVIENYFLFTNPHIFGRAADIRMTPIRVVCNNTMTMALNQASDVSARITHRQPFNPEKVKEMLGLAHTKMETYREAAEFLGSVKAKDEDIVEYFKRIFPVTSKKEGGKEISKNAKLAMDILHTQPGADIQEGTWWQPFNSVTYLIDHLAGRSQDTRLQSAWYGGGRNVKHAALEQAVEFAKAA